MWLSFEFQYGYVKYVLFWAHEPNLVLNVQVFGDEADMYKLEDVQMNDFGTVKEVTVTKDDTLMMKVSLSSFSLFLSLFISDTQQRKSGR